MTFHDDDLCLADSTTMYIILKETKYFEYLTLTKVNVTTISDPIDMKELIFCYQITQNWASKMHYIHLSPEEIYSILKIYVLMVIILKL